MKKFKLGIIGGSIYSAVGNTHQIATQMDGRWEIVTGCFSKNPNTNFVTAKAYGIDVNKIYNDWEEFLNKEKSNIDAVCILTPTNIHKEMVITALNLEIPVICEKALASSYEETLEIKKVLEKKHGFLAVTYNYTGYPMIRELKNIISKKSLGNIQQIHIEMPQEGFLKVDKFGNIIRPQNWRLQDGVISVLSLDLGVHIHNMIKFLINKKPNNLISIEKSLGHFEVIDDIKMIINYADNIQANIWYSKAAIGNRNGLKVKVYGDLASAEWIQMNPEELYLSFNNGKREIIDRGGITDIAQEIRYNRFKAGHPAGFIEAFANCYFDIANSLQNYLERNSIDNSFIYGIDSSLEGLKLLQIAKISSQKATWINFEKEM